MKIFLKSIFVAFKSAYADEIDSQGFITFSWTTHLQSQFRQHVLIWKLQYLILKASPAYADLKATKIDSKSIILLESIFVAFKSACADEIEFEGFITFFGTIHLRGQFRQHMLIWKLQKLSIFEAFKSACAVEIDFESELNSKCEHRLNLAMFKMRFFF